MKVIVDMGKIIVDCPICNNCSMTFEDGTRIEDVKNTTLNCGSCGGLLLITENESVVDFHKHLYESDARWPKDGGNCGIVG